MFETFFQNVAAFAAQIPFDVLVWLIWGTYAGIFLLTAVLTVLVPSFKAASKRPYLCLTYAYTALTFALFLMVNAIEKAAFTACVFWIAGYLCYGIICALSRRKTDGRGQVAACTAPAIPPVRPQTTLQSRPSPAKSFQGAAHTTVRLDHAIAVCARLLEKDLGKTDRQELEKLKNTLEVLKVKGNLTPTEGEILNENFNALLKLMAKYNV